MATLTTASPVSVRPTLGTPAFGCPGDRKATGTAVLHPILNCRCCHEATCAYCIQGISPRQVFYSINPPPASLTHQSTSLSRTCTYSYSHQYTVSMASLDRPASSSRGPTQLPYGRVLISPSPVPYDVPPETSGLRVQQVSRGASVQMPGNYMRSIGCMLARHFRPQKSIGN